MSNRETSTNLDPAGLKSRPCEILDASRIAWEAEPSRVDLAYEFYQALRTGRQMREARRLAGHMRTLSESDPSVPTQDWFSMPMPTGDEMVSVIVPCWNQSHYTKMCLESVIRCTNTSFELIVVDNGSTDDTIDVVNGLAAIARQNASHVRTELIRNPTNQGFAFACNQGLRAARGEFLVLLNNDTIVTREWLTRLVDWSLVNYPRIGLVGPATNYAPPPQFVPIPFTTVDELERAARIRRMEYSEKAMFVERLTGFCVLFRRDILDSIGLLDERFGFGFFEDDDLCVRVRDQGKELLFAQDVFIHHFGSRTVAALPMTPEQLLKENHDKFREKWGSIADRYIREDSNAFAARSDATDKGTISLCMIVKNEEGNLEECLQSARDLVDEIVIVDTGSTDRTKEIALSHGARVFDFRWIDDFAAARNESLRHARSSWIFWMDADDRLNAAARESFRQLRAKLSTQFGGYVMKCECVGRSETEATVVDHVRLFRNDSSIRWKYRIHEQIMPALRAAGAEVAWTEIVIQHLGYKDPAVKEHKRRRDLRLLQLEDQEHPSDPFTLFNLGQVYQESSRDDEALNCFRRSLILSHPRDSIVRKLYALIAQVFRHQGKLMAALQICRDGAAMYLDDPERLFQEALTYQDIGDWLAAERSYRRILETPKEQFFGSSDPALRGFKTRHNLGLVYRSLKYDGAAEQQWMAALTEAPSFLPTMISLAELYLDQSRWSEFDEIIERIKIHPEGEMPHKTLLLRIAGRRDVADCGEMAPRAYNALDLAPPLISLCMIVRNEERHLGRCLHSVMGLVDEVIVMDTGSTDGTREIAFSMGAKVHEILWSNSFAEARTASVQPARGKWILYLDADEYLDPADQLRFRELRSRLTAKTAYMLRQISHSTEAADVWATDHARLFPRFDGLRWTYRVHEQILPCLLKLGCSIVPTDVIIRHSGFANTDDKALKLKRNLQLLMEDLKELSDDGFLWFNRATCHLDLGENQPAIECLERTIVLTPPNTSFVPRAYSLLVLALRRMSRFADGIYAANRGLSQFPNDQELLLQKGRILILEKKMAQAVDCFETIIHSPPSEIIFGVSNANLVAKAKAHLNEIRSGGK